MPFLMAVDASRLMGRARRRLRKAPGPRTQGGDVLLLLRRDHDAALACLRDELLGTLPGEAEGLAEPREVVADPDVLVNDDDEADVDGGFADLLAEFVGPLEPVPEVLQMEDRHGRDISEMRRRVYRASRVTRAVDVRHGDSVGDLAADSTS